MIAYNPMVTIITMSYNSGNSLLLSLESSLNQKYDDLEIIIADDGSEEFPNSAIESLREKYTDTSKRLKVLRNKKNVGTVRNLNNAIRNSEGEILINLSAGDTFYKDLTVSRIVRIMEEKDYPFLITSRELVDKETREVIRRLPDDEELRHIKKLNTSEKQNSAVYTGDFYNLASGSALAYRKCFIEDIGLFDENYLLWEDGPFFAKVTSMGHVIYSCYSEITVCYESGGVSNSKISPKMKNDVIRFLESGLKDSNFTHFAKRKIEYRLRRIQTENVSRVTLKYLDVYTVKKMQYLRRAAYIMILKLKKR